MHTHTHTQLQVVGTRSEPVADIKYVTMIKATLIPCRPGMLKLSTNGPSCTS